MLNNPGIDEKMWKALNQKWNDFVANGHDLEIDFQQITDPSDSSSVLAIDIHQKIDGKWVVQTFQRERNEAARILGIHDQSLDELISIVKKHLQKHKHHLPQAEIITFAQFYGEKTGETRKIEISQENNEEYSVPTSYADYYILNAVAEKIAGLTGDTVSEIKVVKNFPTSGIEYYFSYR